MNPQTVLAYLSLLAYTGAALTAQQEDSILRRIIESYSSSSSAYKRTQQQQERQRPFVRSEVQSSLWNKRVPADLLDPAYNNCPEAEPFPCQKTKTRECISLKHVCDGNNDCSDGWDEDEGVCIAYQRVPAEDLVDFVREQAYWLVPSFFSSIVKSREDLDRIASALSTSANVDVFARTLRLNRDERKKFQTALYAVRGNDLRELEGFGMNPESWTEVKIVFKNLIDSGLLK